VFGTYWDCARIWHCLLGGFLHNHGSSCTTQCMSGYSPSVSTLSCSQGALTPFQFTCSEAPFITPSVQNSAAQACNEGSDISSGSQCTTQCASGYTPSLSALSCSLGVLAPPTFNCTETSCSPPTGIAHGSNPSCSQGASISHGTTCTPDCQAGYVADQASLSCDKGQLTPASFSCTEAPCQSPTGIQHGAAQVCAQGSSIDSGQQCTTQCQSGFSASTASLSCSLGVLSPESFNCTESPCSAPSSISHTLTPSCTQGVTIEHGSTCTPACQVGYTASA